MAAPAGLLTQRRLDEGPGPLNSAMPAVFDAAPISISTWASELILWTID